MLCMIARKRLDCIEDKEGSHRGACGGDGCGDVKPAGPHAPTKYCAQYTNAAHERVDVNVLRFLERSRGDGELAAAPRRPRAGGGG